MFILVSPQNEKVMTKEGNVISTFDLNSTTVNSLHQVVDNILTDKLFKIAVILTKSDILKNLLDDDNEMIIDKEMYDDISVTAINKAVREYLSQTQKIIVGNLNNMVKNDDNRIKYFAVSSLGGAPVEGKIQHVAIPKRITEPLLWTLKTSSNLEIDW